MTVRLARGRRCGRFRSRLAPHSARASTVRLTAAPRFACFASPAPAFGAGVPAASRALYIDALFKKEDRVRRFFFFPLYRFAMPPTSALHLHPMARGEVPRTFDTRRRLRIPKDKERKWPSPGTSRKLGRRRKPRPVRVGKVGAQAYQLSYVVRTVDLWSS